jgi:DNA-binding XRE family transcriptional regulator
MARHTKRKHGTQRSVRRSTDDPKKQAKLAKHLGGVAREARAETRMTQADVAEQVGIATEVYGRLERGRMLPSVTTLRKLCSVLRADANALLGLTSGVPFVPRGEPLSEKRKESPRVRQLLRKLRRLTPTQLNTIGHVTSTLAKSNGSAPGARASSTSKGVGPGGQSA